MKTRITELFGIQYPIICGGMLWVTEPKLCAAISEAGALGVLTADQYNNGEELREVIRDTRKLTSKPIGINITLMPSFRITEEIFESFFRVCCEEKVTNIEVSGRYADKYIPMVHEAGVKITHKVGSVRHALKVEQLGYDAVIAAGVEEGGHPLIDAVATTVLCAKIAETVSIPVISTGGVVDGRSMAAALCLGAEGVLIASRFMVTNECWIHKNIKNYLIEKQEMDTTLINKTTLQARAIKNTTVEKVIELEKKGASIEEIGDLVAGYRLREAFISGDTESAALYVGQSIGRIHEIKSCQAVISEMADECKATLEKQILKMHT